MGVGSAPQPLAAKSAVAPETCEGRCGGTTLSSWTVKCHQQESKQPSLTPRQSAPRAALPHTHTCAHRTRSRPDLAGSRLRRHSAWPPCVCPRSRSRAAGAAVVRRPPEALSAGPWERRPGQLPLVCTRRTCRPPRARVLHGPPGSPGSGWLGAHTGCATCSNVRFVARVPSPNGVGKEKNHGVPLLQPFVALAPVASTCPLRLPRPLPWDTGVWALSVRPLPKALARSPHQPGGR